MLRRLDKGSFRGVFRAAVGQAAEVTGQPTTSDCVKAIDGKPLPIDGYGRPRFALGQGVRTFRRGDKLFAVRGRDRMPLAWRVASLDVSEQAMAQAMLPELTGGGYVWGDKLYDLNKPYAAAAGRQVR